MLMLLIPRPHWVAGAWNQYPVIPKPHCTAAAAAKSLQLCPTLCDPIDGSPPGSPVPGILQAKTLEWVAISFSNAWKWKVKVKSLSRVRLFSTPWTAAHQAVLQVKIKGWQQLQNKNLPIKPISWSIILICHRQHLGSAFRKLLSFYLHYQILCFTEII